MIFMLTSVLRVFSFSWLGYSFDGAFSLYTDHYQFTQHAGGAIKGLAAEAGTLKLGEIQNI